jgi:hypothetical protein
LPLYVLGDFNVLNLMGINDRYWQKNYNLLFAKNCTFSNILHEVKSYLIPLEIKIKV